MFDESTIELEKHLRSHSILGGVRGQQWTFGEGGRAFNPWDSDARYAVIDRELGRSTEWRNVARTLAQAPSRERRLLELRFGPHTWSEVPDLRNALGPLVPIAPFTPTARLIVVGELTVYTLNARAKDGRISHVRDEAFELVRGALAVYDALRIAREDTSRRRRADMLDRELEETRIRLWGKP
jgi:hypothetical protein